MAATQAGKLLWRNVVANHWILKISAPIDVDGAGYVTSIIEQYIFIRLADPDPIVLQMFFQPVRLHEGVWMSVRGGIDIHGGKSFLPRPCSGKGIWPFGKAPENADRGDPGNEQLEFNCTAGKFA